MRYSETSTKLRVLNGNFAALPVVLGIQFNSKIVRPNLNRGEEFIEQIRDLPEEKAYDVIVLEEVWDTRLATYLQRELRQLGYIHQIRGIHGDESYLCGLVKIVRGGLMFFSKFEIINRDVQVYKNLMWGPDFYGRKGFGSAMCVFDKKNYFSIHYTHLEGGNAFFKSLSTWWGGTTSYRRGKAFEVLEEHEANWSFTLPPGYKHLSCCAALTMGDTNTPLNTARQMHGVSEQSANNGFMQNNVKYMGRHNFTNLHTATVPENFMEVRVQKQTLRQGKIVVPALVQEAVAESKFTGTDKGGNNSEQSPVNTLDWMTRRKNGPTLQQTGSFKTNIVSFEEYTPGEQKSFSDHFFVEGEIDFTQDYHEPVDPYTEGNLVRFTGEDPAAGCLTRFFNRLFKPYRYNLFPSQPSEIKTAAPAVPHRTIPDGRIRR